MFLPSLSFCSRISFKPATNSSPVAYSAGRGDRRSSSARISRPSLLSSASASRVASWVPYSSSHCLIFSSSCSACSSSRPRDTFRSLASAKIRPGSRTGLSGTSSAAAVSSASKDRSPRSPSSLARRPSSSFSSSSRPARAAAAPARSGTASSFSLACTASPAARACSSSPSTSPSPDCTSTLQPGPSSRSRPAAVREISSSTGRQNGSSSPAITVSSSGSAVVKRACSFIASTVAFNRSSSRCFCSRKERSARLTRGRRASSLSLTATRPCSGRAFSSFSRTDLAPRTASASCRSRSSSSSRFLPDCTCLSRPITLSSARGHSVITAFSSASFTPSASSRGSRALRRRASSSSSSRLISRPSSSSCSAAASPSRRASSAACSSAARVSRRCRRNVSTR